MNTMKKLFRHSTFSERQNLTLPETGFRANKIHGVTECVAYEPGSKQVFYGIAVCSQKDKYNGTRGELISSGRVDKQVMERSLFVDGKGNRHFIMLDRNADEMKKSEIFTELDKAFTPELVRRNKTE
jgi:hypothetical protein